jgi:putative hydrolase of the HAD superfamily
MPKPFLKTLISHQQLFENFDDGIFSCDLGIAKPQAEIFRLASKQFSLNVSDKVIFIDDNVTNVEAARKFGWHAIHHLSVQQSRQALRQFI